MTNIQTPANWKVHFFALWITQALSLIGSALVQFALIWWLTDTIGLGTTLTTASLVGMLPLVVLSPVAGVVADRFNRRRVMLVADTVVALVTLALAIFFASGASAEWLQYGVYVALFFRGAGSAFHFPAMQASTTLMVPQEHLARIGGLNQMLQGGMGILAPALGALLISVLPVESGGIFLVDVGTATLAITTLLFVSIPQPTRQTTAARPSFVAEFTAGLRYVGRWPGMMGLMAMACILNMLLTPTASLQPLLVTNHFNGQVGEVAVLESAFGVGMVLGGLILGVWGGFKRRTYTSFMGIIGLGVGVFAVGLVPANAFWLAVVSMFGAAMMIAMANGPLMAVMQSTIAPDMQGRVMTLLNTAAMLMSPIGLMIAGPLSDQIGIQSWYLIGGGACIVLGALCYFIPAIANLEDQAAQAAAPAEAGPQPTTVVS